MATSHLAAPALHWLTHVRQRCAWCGTILIDQDLTRVAYKINEDEGIGESTYHTIPTWPVDQWTCRDGAMTFTEDIEMNDQGIIKCREDSCMMLPYELTLSVEYEEHYE
jgi:hypothetical protein